MPGVLHTLIPGSVYRMEGEKSSDLASEVVVGVVAAEAAHISLEHDSRLDYARVLGRGVSFFFEKIVEVEPGVLFDFSHGVVRDFDCDLDAGFGFWFELVNESFHSTIALFK